MIFGAFNLCLVFFILIFGRLFDKKGVCKLNIVYRVNHFNSKWREKYLASFLIGTAFRPSKGKKIAKI